ncbi:unnamed protein product [Ranitomeya imitator]|uniref:histidine--tRNA ligase n=1 Tax=Ranitomeya imitator TaxID=111125 RepID=A0ABN9LQT9_9NEOB|nr:unnamed protein product [Ranitomeya imitator]
MDVSIIGCVVNGPGEALVSTLGVTGGNKKSGFYEDGVRQKERMDNGDMIAQLEARIRAKASMLDETQRISVINWKNNINDGKPCASRRINVAKNIQAIRGMNDYLPADTAIWQKIEGILKQVLASYGYSEIRLPIVEQTPLFKRAIGEVTDVVEKEMYTFDDRNGESLTLRPEGTAGCVRAGIEHGLLYNQEQRLWYIGPMFRYERPQKGRYRQFNQLGVEVFGLNGPDVDAELILLTARWWKALGIDKDVALELNSIGSLDARANYRDALIAFLEQHTKTSLMKIAKRRMYSKSVTCIRFKKSRDTTTAKRCPKLGDYLDDESREHFSGLCAYLDAAGIAYTVNQRLVRGLDYYNRTVFEWVTTSLGAQGTVCAGGRYDGLVEQLGGRPTSAVGFAMGLERLILLVQAINPEF